MRKYQHFIWTNLVVRGGIDKISGVTTNENGWLA